MDLSNHHKSNTNSTAETVHLNTLSRALYVRNRSPHSLQGMVFSPGYTDLEKIDDNNQTRYLWLNDFGHNSFSCRYCLELQNIAPSVIIAKCNAYR